MALGPDCAATLLAAAGDNPHRLRSDAAFAKLCGVSPVEASSGKIVRHRLNRGRNRDANRALHTILVVRMRRHQPNRDYLARRFAEGKDQERDDALRQTLHRPRHLPRPSRVFGGRIAACLSLVTIAGRGHRPSIRSYEVQDRRSWRT